MFIVSLNYIKPLDEVDACLDEHKLFLNAQYDAGHFLLSGAKAPRTGGVILADVSDRSALHAILHQDPFYIAGVAEYQVIEFTPSMAAESLAGLLPESA